MPVMYLCLTALLTNRKSRKEVLNIVTILVLVDLKRFIMFNILKHARCGVVTEFELPKIFTFTQHKIFMSINCSLFN